MAPEILLETENVDEIVGVQEIIDINRMVTEPESYSGENPENAMEADIEGIGFEADRDEDYHHVRERGQLETLINTMLPYECREDSELINLTAFLMTEIARAQAFAEGNKRTSYVTGVLFLIKCQLMARNEAIYPKLDMELTNVLSKVAREQMGRERFEKYLRNRLKKY
jgi:prophage maintenance system killer protein